MRHEHIMADAYSPPLRNRSAHHALVNLAMSAARHPNCGKRHMDVADACPFKSRAGSVAKLMRARANFWSLLVPRLFLFAIAAAFLGLSAASADAMPLNNQAAYVAVDAPAQPSAPLIEGRSAFTQSSETDIEAAIDRVVALGFVALILAMGAVGVKALWILDRKAFTPYDALSQPPYGLLDQPASDPCESTKLR
jgi:hypothetical protein